MQLGGVEMSKVNLEKIKRLRKSYKLSQEEIAKKLGYSSLYPYHRKETGDQSFKAEELHQLSLIFNKPLEYFFEHEVAKNATKMKEENTA